MRQLFKTLTLVIALNLSWNLSAQIMTEETYADLEFFHLVSEMPYFGTCDLPNKNGQTDCFQNAFKNFVKANLVYPKTGKALKEQVKVYVKFVVNEEGEIILKELLKSSGLIAFDQEALAVLDKLPIFTPGKEKGILVKVLYLAVVDFNP
jgi:protein TonB